MAYNEGVIVIAPQVSVSVISNLRVLASRAKCRVKKLRRNSCWKALDAQPLPPDEQPEALDPVILNNFIKRRDVYGDICQSFSPEELEEILKEAGNDAPKAILLMERRVLLDGHPRLFRPPAYYVNSDRGEASFQPANFEAPKRRGTDAGRMTAGLMSLEDLALPGRMDRIARSRHLAEAIMRSHMQTVLPRCVTYFLHVVVCD